MVADEVRGLAIRTTDSTTEISAIINELKTRMDRTAETMAAVVDGVNGSQETARDTAQVIEQIAQEITVSADANNRISTVSRAQKEKIVLLQESLDRLFDTFRENSTKVETTATIGDDLYRVSESLKDLLAQFTFEPDDAVESSPHELRTSPRVDRHLRVSAVQNKLSYESICRDFSMTGIQLRTKEKLDPKAKLQLSVYLPYGNLSDYGNQEPLKLTGKIVWQKTEEVGYACGVKFDELDPAQRKKMQACFHYYNRPAEYTQLRPRSAQA